MRNKTLIPILLIVLLATAGVTIVSQLRNRQDTRSRAASNAVDGELLVDPSMHTAEVNGSFPVSVKVNVGANNYLNIAKVILRYDSVKMTASSCSANSEFQGLDLQEPCIIDVLNGVVNIQLQAKNIDGPSGEVTLATFNVQGNTSGTASLDIQSGYQIVVKDGSIPLPTPRPSKQFTVTKVTNGRYTFGGSGLTPTPVPTSGPDNPILIPIGTTDSLTIQISGGGPIEVPEPSVNPDIPQVRFAIKLFGVQETPDILVRLKVSDLLYQVTAAPVEADTCQGGGNGQKYFRDIPMSAEVGGIYYPIAGGTFQNAIGGTSTVTADGWIPLEGVTAGKPYAFYVKGPLHRDQKMVASVILAKGVTEAQNFSWTNNPLEPGDLPDPNKGGVQDCTVNSVDLSLIFSRLGSQDDTNLNIADVNYDRIVNGNDISKVVHTLSTKPDDDL